MDNLPELSLYVHLPWCDKRCPYCDFNITTDSLNSSVKELFNALKNEQHNIMKDFFRLEQMKHEPYSDDSKEFLDSLQNTMYEVLNKTSSPSSA